jgi:hypothetical protein
MPAVRMGEVNYGRTRFVTYYQGDDPAIGIEIKPGGVIVVGRWLEDGRWVTLHTAIPVEKGCHEHD